MYVYVPCAWHVHKELEEGVRFFFGAGVKGDCEGIHMGAGNSTRSSVSAANAFN